MSYVLPCFSTEKSIFAQYFTVVAKNIGAAQVACLKWLITEIFRIISFFFCSSFKVKE